MVHFYSAVYSNAMVRHFKKLAKYLSGKELAKKIAKDKNWFDKAGKDD